jgi:hypothetical protein
VRRDLECDLLNTPRVRTSMPTRWGKGNLFPCLFFNWTPRHEGALGKWKYSSTHSLTSALEGGEWSASRLGRFIPRERAPDTHWIGGWVGPRAVLDAVVKRKIPKPCWESNPRTLIVQTVAQRFTDWTITALCQRGMKINKGCRWSPCVLKTPATL